MAKEFRRNQPTDELKAEIARSRDRVTRDLCRVRNELDFGRKIRRSFQQQTMTWIAAVAIVGALIAIAPMRRKKFPVPVKSGTKVPNKLLGTGFALGLIKIAASLIRPAVVGFVTQKMRDYAGGTRPTRRL